MPRYLVLLSIVMAVLFGACATSNYSGKTAKETQEDYKAANEGEDEKDDIVCKYEKPTGSNISRKICEKKSDRDARRKSDQRNLEFMQRNSGMTSGGQ